MTDSFSPFSTNPVERQPDKEYLAALEKRLQAVKSKKKITSKSILKDIKSLKNDQLFKLLSAPEPMVASKEELRFENDFVEEQSSLDKSIEPSLIRKKLAPQTCAINKTELASIVKYDLTQKLHEFYRELDETDDDRRESYQILKEIQEVSEELARQKIEDDTEGSSESGSQKNTPQSEAGSWAVTTFFPIPNRGTRPGLQKVSRMHLLPSAYNPWDQRSSSNTVHFSCVLTWDGILSMSNDPKKRTNQWREINLTKIIPFEPACRGGLYEVACSDVSLEQTKDCLAILAVFWVEVDSRNMPTKCFGTLFRVSQGLDVTFCEAIPVPSMVAWCRLTDRKKATANNHCLLVFPRNAEVSAYKVEPNSIVRIEDVFEWFPSLALTNLPGGALRTSCVDSGDFRYSAVGLDTGILIVSVCMQEGNVILDSVRLKFAGPLSVVEFLPQITPCCQRILVSSCLGPAAIWRVHFEEDKLRFEPESILAGSQYHDSVLCACVYRFYHGRPPWILIGTFSGKILRYQLPPPTLKVVRAAKELRPVGRPSLVMMNLPVYSIKQSGLNEISVVTPFGLTVLRESLNKSVRHSSLSYLWMEKYQMTKIARKKKILLDFSKRDIKRASIESNSIEMRPRVGSTVSNFTRKSDEDGLPERRRMTLNRDFQYQPRDGRSATAVSPSVSTSSSATRLKQLDVTVAEQYYQDGPSEMRSDSKSPNKCAPSPRMGAIQESSPPQMPSPSNHDRLTSIFRFGAKKSASSADQHTGKFFK